MVGISSHLRWRNPGREGAIAVWNDIAFCFRIDGRKIGVGLNPGWTILTRDGLPELRKRRIEFWSVLVAIRQVRQACVEFGIHLVDEEA